MSIRTTYRPHLSKKLCFACALFFVAAATYGQVTSAIDSTNIKIGEEIQYSIEVQADTTDLVVFPEGQSFLPLEVIESYKVDTLFDNARYRLLKKYGLTQFDSGSYTIPSQRVIINEKAYSTDSVRVEVANVVVDTTQQKMFTIKPALDVKHPPFDFLGLLKWLLPILAILGLIVYFIFRRKKRKEAKEEILPPYEEALFALKKLDATELLKEHKSKEYYSGLTEIIKRYLDREVDDSALESTTNELIERLQMHRDAGNFEFDSETIQKLDKILKRADLIKFAKMREQEGQAQVDRSLIEEIINETHEVIPEPTEEELLENEQFLEEQRKKQQKKRVITWALGGIAALVLAGVIYGSVTGFDNLQDKVIGNELRELAEGRWIKSEYGNPRIILETPDVLVRTEIENPNPQNSLIKQLELFTFGSPKDPIYIMLRTTELQQEQELAIGQALEAALTDLEQSGAKNFVVKQEDFETSEGIKGLKAYGDFNLQVSDTKVLKNKSVYELIIFAQQNGLQQVLVVYQDDGRFSEDIKDRIIRSIELEIQESKKE